MLGTYAYPGEEMEEEKWGVKPGEHIPGEVLHSYLTAFAQKFGVLERTRFNTKLDSIERGEKGGWLLNVKGERAGSILAQKLILATGVTSQAFLPNFEGQESFGKPLFHSKNFSQNADTLKTVNKVTIFGATKSAWDAVYAYATVGVEVDWVIRGMVP